MLTRVDIANYRGFKSYRMEGLAQVNLIVGKNNSGKTALVEAIHFATTGGDPTILTETAIRRGEVIETEDSPRTLADVTHFFHGHQIGPGSVFSIAADNGYSQLFVRLVDMPQDPELFPTDGEGFDGRAVMGLQIEGGTGYGSRVSDIGLSERGGLIFDRRARFGIGASLPQTAAPTTVFLPTESVSGAKVTQLWRNALLDASNPQVVSAVQLVESEITEILYVPSESGPRSTSSFRNFFVKTKAHPKPIPLGSFGDGSRRLMILAVALARTAHGTLLVDEIDTGLHYSVMADMWKLVIKKALASNVQVFATTHSWDCIEGLSTLCQRDPELVNRVSIHKVDRALQNSVAFSGESLVRMLRSDIDPR